jgi:predicted site-specific integrase-resolvase
MESKTIKKHVARRKVCELLDVCPPPLRRYELKGLLHPVRLTDRTIRYEESEVVDLLKSLKGEA